MASKRDRFSTTRDILIITMFIIGPFILEHSAPNATFSLMLLATALGCLYGFSMFHIKRRPIYFFIALGLNVAILCLLADAIEYVGPVCVNWAGGFLAGFMVGMWPVNSAAEAEERQKEEPAPGWHLNNQELASVSMLTDQALAKLRGLDGSAHYFLCVTYGPSRIDIIGHYDRSLVVLCTPDVHDFDNWSILIAPSTNEQIIEFRAGPDHTKLPANNLVDAQLAQKALESFIAHQAPDPTLTWFNGHKVYARRPRSTRVLSEKTWPQEDSSKVQSSEPHDTDRSQHESRQAAADEAATPLESRSQPPQVETEIPGMLPAHNHHRRSKAPGHDQM